MSTEVICGRHDRCDKSHCSGILDVTVYEPNNQIVYSPRSADDGFVNCAAINCVNENTLDSKLTLNFEGDK